ncbi:hypothetical protein WJX77_011526 [Trebouxia sp. C0004]
MSIVLPKALGCGHTRSTRAAPGRSNLRYRNSLRSAVCGPSHDPVRRCSCKRVILVKAEQDPADSKEEQLEHASSSRPAPVGTGDFNAGDVLGGAYTVVETLGRGSSGVTYKASNAEGKLVAVKALSLQSMSDWKQLDLFQREANTLKQLQHPGIPRYVADFEDDTDKDRGYYLVQDLAQGRSLAELVKGGWRADEGEVTRIAKELLNILDYLASRRPAVTHRDVKPENIVLEGGKAGGRVFLVDFGGVQAAALDQDFGSTIIGTYGYMAPEQFRGAAQPASDLYALGGTLLYLLSGKPPSAFPQDRLHIDFSQEVSIGHHLATVVDGLLEPLVEDRLSAAEALEMLTQQDHQSPSVPVQSDRQDASSSGRFKFRQPAGSRCTVKRSGTKLSVEIPPAKLGSEQAYTGAFAIAWNAFVAFWTVGALAGGGVLFALFSLPFWFAGVSLGKTALAGSLIRENLDIGQQKWSLSQHLPFVKAGAPRWSGGGKEISGRTRDLSGASMVTAGYVNGIQRTHIQLTEGVRQHIIGEGLSRTEQVWLTSAINEHLKRLGTDVSDANAAQQRWLSEGPAAPTVYDQDRTDINFGEGFFDDEDILADDDWKKL